MESTKHLKLLFETWVREWIKGPDPFEIEFDEFLKPSNQEVAEFYIRLFENPPWLVTEFTRDELAEGIWNICGVQSPWRNAIDVTVPEEIRRRCIFSIGKLYTGLFDPWCAAVPFEKESDDQFSSAVGMIWDMDSINPTRDDPLFRKAYATVFQVILNCESSICVGSGLHGIGHWIRACDSSGDVELSVWLRTRIDDFLALYRQRPDASQRLIAYALAARTGSIM